MPIPQVDSCCCGLLPLKEGSLVCGIASLILSGSQYYVLEKIKSEDIRLVYWVLIILGFIGAILVIVGALLDRPGYAKLYIAAYGLLFLLTILGIAWQFMTKSPVAEVIGGTFFYLCFIAYFIIVVNSWTEFI